MHLGVWCLACVALLGDWLVVSRASCSLRCRWYNLDTNTSGLDRTTGQITLGSTWVVLPVIHRKSILLWRLVTRL